MEKITYILGAGFSAPAGLPLMNNFILKAKDMYYSDPEKFNYFLKIFEKIDSLSKIKNFFTADLYNIEEVLSLFETESILYRNTKFRNDFIKFIIDVINNYTFKNLEINFAKNVTNYHSFVLGGDQIKKIYGCFVCSLLGLQINKSGERNESNFYIQKIPKNDIRYSIVTLNYDTILENCLESIIQRYSAQDFIEWNKERYDSEWKESHLVKLHGCVKNKNIIPPTWAKSTTNEIGKIWKNAYNLIKDSTQIRIIGYSLPVTDSNVRFLLKSAMLKNQTLKKIDVINLDSVKQENRKLYEEFIDFNYYSFKNYNTQDYLMEIAESTLKEDKNFNGVIFNKIEAIHNSIMSN
jgi:hypothetical protein